jgi:hypothetical protein
MKPPDFMRQMHCRIGVTAVGPSTLRGQGKGVLRATQVFLTQLNLNEIPLVSERGFHDWLDTQTESLLGVLQEKAGIENRPWGAARKALNLFLRDILYNQYLNRHFRLDRLESWLEIPLDRVVAEGLQKRAVKANRNLPRWPGLKELKSGDSERYQSYALECARQEGIERVHLDAYLWIENR